MKFLITCLGNPGEQYAFTRHNIGFLVADQLADKLGAIFQTGRYADVAHAKFRGKECVIIKPNTFMNLSGKAVRYWLQEEKIPMERMMVINDDIALPFGKIRIRKKGSDGGHNGLRSIQELIGTNDFARMRFGVGNDFPKGRQSEYVLGVWDKDQADNLEEKINYAVDAILSFMSAGIELTMSNYNRG